VNRLEKELKIKDIQLLTYKTSKCKAIVRLLLLIFYIELKPEGDNKNIRKSFLHCKIKCELHSNYIQNIKFFNTSISSSMAIRVFATVKRNASSI